MPGHKLTVRQRARNRRFGKVRAKVEYVFRVMKWDGPAALPPPTALRVRGGLVRNRSTIMPRKSTVHPVTAIGIDMGKTTLHMVGLDPRCAIVLREKISRGRIASRLANVPRCLIGIEAGMATHYVALELATLGHDVKQVPPAYAKPFRQCPDRCRPETELSSDTSPSAATAICACSSFKQPGSFWCGQRIG